MEDFEALWNRVNDVYPFLEFKKIDWDSIYTLYHQRVKAANGDEFYPILNDLLAELKDGHVYYHTDGGGEVYPYYPRRHFKDRHAYSPFVVRRYFNSELIVTESESAEYGILPGNIGYVFLSNFHENYLTIETYINPVVVIINGSTFSTGEWTTEILKQLPVVTVIGDTTGGGGVASSDASPETVGEYQLPSGKVVYIGTEYFERYDGQPVEWFGVTPDIRVVQTEEDVIQGRDKQLEYAIDMLK